MRINVSAGPDEGSLIVTGIGSVLAVGRKVIAYRREIAGEPSGA